MAVPLVSANYPKTRIIAIKAASGLPTLIGAMIYVAFHEMVPQSLKLNRNKMPIIPIVIGIVVGMLLENIIK